MKEEKQADVSIESLAEKVLKGYEEWESELIMDNRCWGAEGMNSLPTLTRELYDKMLELQSQRNEVLAGYAAANQPRPHESIEDKNTKSGVELIANERHRQIEKEGWDKKHDSFHEHGELAIAAACYAVEHTDAEVTIVLEDAWPWEEKWDKRKKHSTVKRLVIAGALIAAELDRINNGKAAAAKDGQAENSFLKVLEENYEATKKIEVGDFETGNFSSGEKSILLETYEDLISIYKAKNYSVSTQVQGEGNYVDKILHGLAPCHAPNKSYRDVVYGLRSALKFANDLPHGSALTGWLCDIANLIWDYENSRLATHQPIVSEQVQGVSEEELETLWRDIDLIIDFSDFDDTQKYKMIKEKVISFNQKIKLYEKI